MNSEKEERSYLRELASQVAELAALPVMDERRKLWMEHNAGHETVPVVLMEMATFENDLLGEGHCRNELYREMEKQLRRTLINYHQIGDDKVVDAVFGVPRRLSFRLFDLEQKFHTAEDSAGRALGYAFDYAITDLNAQLDSLRESTWTYDAGREAEEFACAQELLGDILTVRYENHSLEWIFALTAHTIGLMGMENLYIAMLESPDALRAFLERIVDDLLRFVRFQEEQGLLQLNNGNVYAGSGSYGFTDELPRKDFTGRVRSCDLWVNMNSQESVGISPDAFREHIYPHYRRIAEEFGLVYYGCCEAVHPFWEAGLKDLPHLRKVSISPWCDEAIMGEALRDSGICYCRKVSPNFIGVGTFDRDALRRSIRETLEKASGCAIEFSYRDIYTLCGEKTRAAEAVAITREEIRRI